MKVVRVSGSTHSRFSMAIGLEIGDGEVEGHGPQLQSAAEWVRLKQCLLRETFARPTKAMFHKEGSILAQVVSGDVAVFCLK